MSRDAKRKVVITGAGAVSALGLGLRPLWEALDAGRSGAAPVTLFDAAGFATQFACEVKAPSGAAKDFSARDFVPKHYRKATKVMARDTEIAVAAAKLAVEDAKLATRGTVPEGDANTTYPAERVGCHIGAGLLTAETEEISLAMATAVDPAADAEHIKRNNGFSLAKWGTAEGGGKGMDNLTPLWMLKYLPNMLSCHVTIIHGAEGPSNTITCAEASALLSLGESMRVIRRGAADACYSGGGESKVSLMGIMRMELAGRIAHTTPSDDPTTLCKPFDAASRGGLLGEGAGILILEEESAAARRGITPYCRLAGFGAAQSPPPSIPYLAQGQRPRGGLERAIRAALNDAGIDPSGIDAIVPQGSGIPSADAAEAADLRAVFGSRGDSIPILALAPAIGDCAAGNGGLHTAVAAMSLREKRLPAGFVRTLSPGRAAGGGAGAAWGVPGAARQVAPRRILVCTGGMGGQNAAIVLETI